MSGSVPASAPPGGSAAAADPSMEDILASIRRILSEDEVKEEPAAAQPAAGTADAAEGDDDVLVLDPKMIVTEEAPAAPTRAAEEAPDAPPRAAEETFAAPPREAEPSPAEVPLAMLAQAAMTTVEAEAEPPFLPPALPPFGVLVGPEAAAAASHSVDTLMRTLSTERSMQVTSLGPTIEDIVRQEIRPLLKAWLDVNLPPLVERLVRAEIERVVGRAAT